jgi:hypothetical protein
MQEMLVMMDSVKNEVGATTDPNQQSSLIDRNRG